MNAEQENELKAEKLVHQLFIGKVIDEIGSERTTELLKEAKEFVKQNSPKK